MCCSFFSPAGKIKTTKTDSEIIQKLTSIRISGYKPHKINQDIETTDIDSIKALIKKLGDNILKANVLAADGTDKYVDTRTKFHSMLDDFIAQSNKCDITVYAAQLLQYYTVVSDDAFTSELSSHEFEQFLTDNDHGKFGNTQKNAFIVEYKLIKIYNELTTLTDAASGKIAHIVDSNEKAMVLVNQLIELQQIVSDYTIQAPDNVFPQYLTFVINYTTAKLLELNYIIQDAAVEKLAPEDGLQLSDIQQVYLGLSKQALKEIDDLPRYFEERGLKHIKGMEYCFGQEILHKFPITDLEKTTDHLVLLTA